MARNTQGDQTGRQPQNPNQNQQNVERGDRQNRQPQNQSEEEEE